MQCEKGHDADTSGLDLRVLDVEGAEETGRSSWKMERETGIEPATNSLGSCDSTTELLPLSLSYLTVRLVSGSSKAP
jgi:hypothetical protein